jgi:hypothetical protein
MRLRGWSLLSHEGHIEVKTRKLRAVVGIGLELHVSKVR